MENEPDKYEVQRWVIPCDWQPQIVRTGDKWTVQVAMTTIAHLHPNAALELVAGINRVNKLLWEAEKAAREQTEGRQ